MALKGTYNNDLENLPASGITVNAAGNNTEIQFNNNGILGANSGFTCNSGVVLVGPPMNTTTSNFKLLVNSDIKMGVDKSIVGTSAGDVAVYFGTTGILYGRWAVITPGVLFASAYGYPDSSAQLDVTSTIKGFLKPRMNQIQRDSIITPAVGLEIFNTTSNQPNYYNGTVWLSSVTGIPAGSNTQIQYNNNGAFGASSGYTYDANPTATANNQIISGLRINPTFNTSGYTGIKQYAVRLDGNIYANVPSIPGQNAIEMYNSGGSVLMFLASDGHSVSFLGGGASLYNKNGSYNSFGYQTSIEWSIYDGQPFYINSYASLDSGRRFALTAGGTKITGLGLQNNGIIHPSAVLELDGNGYGALGLPRMTSGQRDNLNKSVTGITITNGGSGYTGNGYVGFNVNSAWSSISTFYYTQTGGVITSIAFDPITQGGAWGEVFPTAMTVVNDGGSGATFSIQMGPPKPITGATIFNTTSNNLNYYDGTVWRELGNTTTIRSWGLLGNSGTTSSNFLGTTDNQSLIFKTNNQKSAELNPINGNAYFGYQAGNVNTSGINNTGIGITTLLSNTTGANNTAIGYQSLFSSTTGSGNIAIGRAMTFANANNNIGIGYNALSNTSGGNNVAIGDNSMSNNTSGVFNTMIGGGQNGTGNYNVSVGPALRINTSGGNNVAVGMQALDTNGTGNANTALGYQTSFSQTTGSYNVAVGHRALWSNNANNNVGVGFDAGFFRISNNGLYLGSYAGKYSGGSNNEIVINTIDRGSYAADLTNSPIYIQQNSTLSSQNITLNGKVKINDGTQAAGYVFTSDANGLGSWVAPTVGTSTSGWSLLGNSGTTASNFLGTTDNQPFVIKQNNLQVFTLLPNNNISIFGGIIGNSAIGSIAVGSGSEANGANSFSFGSQNKSNGTNSFVAGYNNIANGVSSVAMGEGNTTTNEHSVAMGVGNTAGQFSVAMGVSNTASYAAVAMNANNLAYGAYSSAFGLQNRTNGKSQFVSGNQNIVNGVSNSVFGQMNDTSTGGDQDFIILTDKIFEIGNGDIGGARRNAVTVLRNGKIGFGTVSPTDLLHIVGKLRIVDGTQAAGYIFTSDANGVGSWAAPTVGASSGSTSTSGWSLLGNSGTTSSNFLGTIDVTEFVIRTNNIERLRIDTTGKGLILNGIGFGYGGGIIVDNLAIGVSTLTNNTTGNANIAIGTTVLGSNTTGASNIGIGLRALSTNTTGSNNIAIGYDALRFNSANSNIGIGFQSLYNSIGGSNTSVGHNSMSAANSGGFNVAMGITSLRANTTGGGNVAIGGEAMINNTTGSANTIVGTQGLGGNSSGNSLFGYQIMYFSADGANNNSAIGQNALFVNVGTNNIAIGYFSGRYNTTASNQIFINSLNRLSYSGDQTASPIYILQDAIVSNQIITLNGKVKISDGTQAAGYVFTSDANGVGSWAAPTGINTTLNYSWTGLHSFTKNTDDAVVTMQNTRPYGTGGLYPQAAQKWLSSDGSVAGYVQGDIKRLVMYGMVQSSQFGIVNGDGMIDGGQGANGIGINGEYIAFMNKIYAGGGHPVGKWFANSGGGLVIETANLITQILEEASSLFTVRTTTKGTIPAPKMNITQRDAILSATTGLQIYNTTTNQPNYFDGTNWLSFISSGGTSQWTTTGTSIYYNTGNVLIGTTTDDGVSKLQVNGIIKLGIHSLQDVIQDTSHSLNLGGTIGLGSDRALTIGGTATGLLSLAIGNNTNATNSGVAIGGYGTTATGGIAIGNNIFSTKSVGDNAIAIGSGNSVYGYAVGINGNVGTLGNPSQGVAIQGTVGPNLFNGSIAIMGYAAANQSIAMYGTSTATNEFVAGSAYENYDMNNYAIKNVYFGSGKSRETNHNTQAEGNGISYTINGSGANGTNFNGGDITIAGGKGTGSGATGSIIFSIPTPLVSGSTLQSLSERMRVSSLGNILIGTSTDTGQKLQINGKVKINDGTQAVGYVFTSDANGVGTWVAPTVGASSGSTLAAGSNTQIQFNNNGALGASSGLTFNSNLQLLIVDNIYIYQGLNRNVGNIVIGKNEGSAGISLNHVTTGINNTGIGSAVLQGITTGSNNVALGFQNLRLNSTGNDNIAIGTYSLGSITGTSGNVAVGSGTLQASTTSNNVAIGFLAATTNASGSDNTSVGSEAFRFGNSGSSNVFVGRASGIFATGLNYSTALGASTMVTATGSGNVALGYLSGYGVTGNYNTFLGYSSGSGVGSGQNNIIIGAQTAGNLGITTGSNNTIIGSNIIGLSSGLTNNIIIADGTGNQRINVNDIGNVKITSLATNLTPPTTSGSVKMVTVDVNGTLSNAAISNNNLGGYQTLYATTIDSNQALVASIVMPFSSINRVEIEVIGILADTSGGLSAKAVRHFLVAFNGVTTVGQINYVEPFQYYGTISAGGGASITITSTNNTAQVYVNGSFGKNINWQVNLKTYYTNAIPV